MQICVLENAALNKPSWQDDDFFNFTAHRAVDGRKSSLTVYGEDCVNSDLKNTTEWRVDLENMLSIHHILIQFATDDKDWGTICFYCCYVFQILQIYDKYSFILY